MSRKAIATKETVAAAVDKLLQAGLTPSVAQVRDALGGGSYTTISQFLSQLRGRGSLEPQVTEMPVDLAEIANRAILSIYGAIQKAVNARVEILEREAGLRANLAERARLEAELEIEKLEQDAAALALERDDLSATLQQALARAERAEGQLTTVDSEIQRLRGELGQALRTAELAQNKEAEIRGQLSAKLERAKEESARLAAQIASLQRQETSPHIPQQ